MAIVRPREWVTFGFDDEGRLRERAINFGLFSEAARNLFMVSDSERRGFNLAAGLLVAPDLDRESIQEAISDALTIRLPANLGQWLAPYNRTVWCGDAF